MTFLILTEDISLGEALTVQIKLWVPNSLCLEISSFEEATAALREVLVDCVILAENSPACDFTQWVQQPRLVLWPAQLDAAAMAAQLFSP